jgi:hypothetical protein
MVNSPNVITLTSLLCRLLGYLKQNVEVESYNTSVTSSKDVVDITDLPCKDAVGVCTPFIICLYFAQYRFLEIGPIICCPHFSGI